MRNIARLGWSGLVLFLSVASISTEAAGGQQNPVKQNPVNTTSDRQVALAEEGAPPAGKIVFTAPTDGGTPRDASRIVSLGNNEYRILASVEEGKELSFLRHAVSRIDLICHNAGSEPVEVTLHLDLSDDGRRTSFDDKPEAGMLLRDFLFIRPPGEKWQQVNGTTSGWVATVKFTAPPGETKIGLGPWYTYGDYLRFIQELPNHPHLKKNQLERSDQGREHWELTITDPGVPAEHKRTIFWHAREHAYETFSSFAMEGLVEYLLSDDAADARRRYVVVLHPMTNVDGVAQGYEYRGGYDLPKPRATATGRLTFETVDRLRPDFAVAWHNWNAPRDRDVVFYTDAAGGEATRRAWDLFTRRFMSPRATQHRWRDETNPLKYNWFGRKPLSEGNVHQYAMKHYGTSVWGWEMPWWNRSEEFARAAGAEFGRALLTTLDELTPAAVPPEPQADLIEVPRWDMHEFVLHGSSEMENPFRDAALVGEFTAPSGKVHVIEGFFDGGDAWRLRFTPDEEGDWQYRLRGEGVKLSQAGQLRCTSPRGPGFIVIDPEHPTTFRYQNGERFFPLGDTAYYLMLNDLDTIESFIKLRREHRYNFLRIIVSCDADYWLFGGTKAAPDFERINVAAMQKLDEVFSIARRHGMNLELIIFGYDPINVAIWSQPAVQNRLVDYLARRYGAFSNLFLWNVANEFERYPSGLYGFEEQDVDWALEICQRIQAADAYRHPRGVHCSHWTTERGGLSYRGRKNVPWQSVWPLWGAAEQVPVFVTQNNTGIEVPPRRRPYEPGDALHSAWQGVEYTETWTPVGWDFEAAGLEDAIADDWQRGKPILNLEFGYQYEPGVETDFIFKTRQSHSQDSVRRKAWKIATAGGFFAMGYATAWHGSTNDTSRFTPTNWRPQQIDVLYDFFTKNTQYWRMAPHLELVPTTDVCLAEPGREYVVYAPRGGTATLTLANGQYQCEWLNPVTGETIAADPVSGPAQAVLPSPLGPGRDVVLHLVRMPIDAHTQTEALP